MKSWLHDNGIEIYSTHSEGKFVVDERFIRTLKNKIYKHTNAVSENVYINKLDKIEDKYNNTYHKTIKMKSAKVKSGTYIEYGVEHNDKDTKFKVGDYVRISNKRNGKCFNNRVYSLFFIMGIFLKHL